MTTPRVPVWKSRSLTLLTLTPNTTGTIDVFTPLVAGTLIRVIVNHHWTCVANPAVGVDFWPPYLLMKLEGRIGTGTYRTLRQNLYRMNWTLSTYVPSGSVKTFWYAIGEIGDQDLYWDFETRLGEQGSNNLGLRWTISSATDPYPLPHGVAANLYGQALMRYLILT